MAIIKIQNKEQADAGIYCEYDSASEPLGEGGMGKVYAGKLIGNNGNVRNVAIKRIFDSLEHTVLEKARREASIQIKHDNLVEMMGFISTDTKSPQGNVTKHFYVVSELLTGVTLDDLMNGVVTTKSGETIPYAQKMYALYKGDQIERETFAIEIIKKVLAGIQALHDNNFIHRDIDPTNIMITKDGKVKLIDFGISKKINKLGTTDKSMTQEGVFIGKPHYAAPELVVGDIANHNETTDIYALGILFYRLLTGDLPFKGASNLILKAQLHSDVPKNNIVNPYFANVITKAMEKDQKSRYQSAAEFRVAVDGLIDKRGKRRMPLWIKIAACSSIVIAFVAMIVYGISNIPTEQDKASIPDNHHKTKVVTDTLQSIKSALYNSPATAKKALPLLKERANTHVDEAYLYSRLHFISHNPGELSDSIIIMQKNLAGVISLDNKVAHNLLIKAERLDPNNYKVLYELGQDFYRDDRGAKFSAAISKDYFIRAKDAARFKGDTIFYESKIRPALSKF